MSLLEPNATHPRQLPQTLRRRGYAVLLPDDLATLAGCPLEELQALSRSWDDLRPDQYLKDGGRYRQRRHACYIVGADSVQPVPHRAHWQPVEYNALHGGMQRWFEPVDGSTAARPAWGHLLRAIARVCNQAQGGQPQPGWHVEAHQFRIDTTDGIGRPTPEGAHRDGVDYVAVILVGRHQIRGGETRVFEADGPRGERFTLTEPWSLLLLDDRRVIHESTPIQPDGAQGHRDTLVLTYRSGGFQGP